MASRHPQVLTCRQAIASGSPPTFVMDMEYRGGGVSDVFTCGLNRSTEQMQRYVCMTKILRNESNKST